MNTPNRNDIGVRTTADGTHISVWAPTAEIVQCKVEDLETLIALDRGEYGYWETNTNAIKTGDRYRFVVDGETYPDPASYSQPDGVHGASQVVDLSFPWTDAAYKVPAMKDLIIYELHVGTFTATHDFKGVIGKLPYLKKLGINAIEIMPIGQFPGERNWGYDGVFPFAVQDSYGGPKAFQELVNAAHAIDIAIILDVVYNHFGPEGNYAPNFGPYFTDKYGTPWGSAINFDDAYSHGVRDFVLANVRMWFADFHVDALRIDAAHALKDWSASHILQDIRRETDNWIETQDRAHYLIVECDLNDTRYLDSLDKNGFAMDGQWVDEFHHALRVAAGGQPDGYYSDFSGVKDLAKALQNAYVYTGQYSEHRKKFFGTETTGVPGERFVVFSQNHDQTGNRMLGERSSMLFSADMQRLMALTVMASPYVPMLFMGEEWSASTPFQYFVHHSDEELVEAVRKGRKEEFKSFQSEGETPDPQAETTFASCVLNWGEVDTGVHQAMLAYYEALISFRKSNSILRQVDRSVLTVQYDEGKSVIVLSYAFEEQLMVGILNFSSSLQSVSLDSAYTWERIWDTSDPAWGGSGPTADLFSGELSVAGATGVFFQRL
ncbi:MULTISPECIES: malto-oligosyltrehalose trehalohydrolase [Sphingobacterium]|uniref:Malto-oligosyltrehalose trehalohydrolase n=1 Tax=Sphingobacterium populi TaxID=1812824 RepID=A0ABW5UHI9_9SPHI|nr:malto-oligosyltrehalose trehalohydrolase [Sphingobacterium sp. CFCC 11742]